MPNLQIKEVLQCLSGTESLHEHGNAEVLLWRFIPPLAECWLVGAMPLSVHIT